MLDRRKTGIKMKCRRCSYMFVEPCPKCGRLPKIVECCVNQKYKNGIRRRLCECPNLCSVIPCKDGLNHGWFEFDGDGDANVMYRQWNLAIELYKENSTKPWYERVYDETWRD